MDKTNLVVELLEKYWADECDAAGSTNVHDIAQGDVIYEPAEGGSYIELAVILACLATASTFVKNAYDIYLKWKEEKNKKLNPSELKAEMTKESLEPEEISEEVKDEVYKSICEKLDQ